jgi:hypothetical protein
LSYIRIRKITVVAHSDGSLREDLDTENGGLNGTRKETTIGGQGKAIRHFPREGKSGAILYGAGDPVR